jgi:hypothetical protein
MYIAACQVRMLEVEVKLAANTKSFQLKRKANMLATATPGQISGKVTRQNAVSGPAPSTHAGLLKFTRDGVEEILQQPDDKRPVAM